MNRKVTVVGGAGNVGATVARSIAEKGLADVVIIDIYLREVSGLGVLHEDRRLGNGSMALVVVSNYAAPEMRRKCSELGATRVFDKSADLDDLLTYCSACPHGCG